MVFLRTKLGVKMFNGRFSTMLVALGLLGSGCGVIDTLMGEDVGLVLKTGADQLSSGDWPAAADTFTAGVAGTPESVDLATGAAYTALLQGDYARADRYLAATEPTAGDRTSEVKLRRAIVALQAGDLDSVVAHGLASSHGIGTLLAAEVMMADGDSAESLALLEPLTDRTGKIGVLANQYVTLLSSGDLVLVGLAEAQALWALGERKTAVKTATELVDSLGDEASSADEWRLMWASRGVSVGLPDESEELLAGILFPPTGQAWRKMATEAMVACARQQADECESGLSALEGVAPPAGLADARATAAMLLSAEHQQVAERMAGTAVTNANARAMLEIGNRQAAAALAPNGKFADFLGQGG